MFFLDNFHGPCRFFVWCAVLVGIGPLGFPFLYVMDGPFDWLALLARAREEYSDAFS